jgi:hypothetical protein
LYGSPTERRRKMNMEKLLEHEDPVVRRIAYVWDTCLAREEDFIWPCLVGPTGAGKTSRVYQLARELGRPIVKLLLAQQYAEEISGYPRPVDGVVKFLPLEAIRKAVEEPVILFLDELDKPRKENRSVVLELLWEKRLRDQELHPETLIVGAMQEVDEAWTADTDTEAIAARLLFISVPYNWEWLERKTGLDLAYFKQAYSQEIPLPHRPRAGLRQVKFLVDVAFSHPRLIFENREDLAALAAGLLPSKDVKPFVEALSGGTAIKLEIIARDPEAVRRMVESGNTDILLELSPHVAYSCPDPKAWPELLGKLAELDPTNELVIQAYLRGWEKLYSHAENGTVRTAWSKKRRDIVEFARAMDAVSKKTARNYLKAYEEYMSGIRGKKS